MLRRLGQRPLSVLGAGLSGLLVTDMCDLSIGQNVGTMPWTDRLVSSS